MRPKINTRLNTLGQLCPQPIIETAQRIKKIKKGQVLEIISDDWGMMTDLPAWCKSTGHLLISIKEEKDLIRSYVKKKSKESKRQRHKD
jgi:tRNA 2-thiouridine synthesizing protein A